jgi:hypothetical protein
VFVHLRCPTYGVDCLSSEGDSNHTRTTSASSNFLSEHRELLRGGVDGDDLPVEHGGAGRYEGDGLSDAGEDDSVALLTGDGGGDVAPRGGGGDFEEEHDFDGNGGDDDVEAVPHEALPPASSFVDGLLLRSLEGMPLPQFARRHDALMASLKDKMSSRADRQFLLGQQGSFTNVSRTAPLGPQGGRSQLNQGEWWKRTEDEYCPDGAQVCLPPIICFIDKPETHCDGHWQRHPPRVTLALVVR